MKGSSTMRGRNILFLSGRPGTGKTLALQGLLANLSSTGIRAGGILAPGSYTDSGLKEYGLELVPGGRKFLLSSRIARPGWQAIGGFYFNPEAVSAGLSHLSGLDPEEYSLCLLDEIGPFELDGRVWAPAIPGLLERELTMIWTVRPGILELVKNKWNLAASDNIAVNPGEYGQSVQDIRKWLGTIFG